MALNILLLAGPYIVREQQQQPNKQTTTIKEEKLPVTVSIVFV